MFKNTGGDYTQRKVFMNKQRRKTINEIIEALQDLQGAIDEVLQDEQDAYDNMPESLQNSERGENSENAIGELEEALSCLDDCIRSLEGSVEY